MFTAVPRVSIMIGHHWRKGVVPFFSLHALSLTSGQGHIVGFTAMHNANIAAVLPDSGHSFPKVLRCLE